MKKLNIEKASIIEVSDWNEFVEDIYGKPYNFQQQSGCRDRGVFDITVPNEEMCEDELPSSIPEKINGEHMCVKFEVWENTDPQTHKQSNNWADWETNLFWQRNFYPDINTLANDLYNRSLLEAGNYLINIDW